MIPRYAGVGIDCPEWDIEITNDGSITTTGTIYFAFQLFNRAGLNRAFISDRIDYAPGNAIAITVPDTVAKPAWDIHYYILSASSTSAPDSFVQLARLPGYQYGEGIEPQSIPTVLPIVFELTEDEHVAITPNVATFSALPATPLDGMVRWVLDESRFVEYHAETASWETLQNANTNVLDTTVDGSDRNLTSLNPTDIIPHPIYPAAANTKSLPGWESKYFLYNNDANPLAAGTEFGIELSYNNKRSPDLLNGLFLIKFSGFADASGNLRTTNADDRAFNNVGGFFSWEPRRETPFVLDDDLLPGEAIALSVKPFFSTAELNNEVPPGAVIGILPVIRTQSGDYNPFGKLLRSDYVFAEGDRYRVLPGTGLSFEIGSGTAIVASYDFPVKPKRTIFGLLENTSGQKVIINGNGAVYRESPSYQPTTSEALRALVSTVAGESAIGAWSDYLQINNGAIAITSILDKTIRDDYPDVIKGTAATINATSVNVYVQRQSDSEIRRFSIGFLPTQTEIATVITDFESGIVATPSMTPFSLFTPGATTAVEAVGALPAGQYRAAVAFVYDGTTVTGISHASPPAIPEWNGALEPPVIVAGDITIYETEQPPLMTVTPTENPGEYKIDIAFFVPTGSSPRWDAADWDNINWDGLN